MRTSRWNNETRLLNLDDRVRTRNVREIVNWKRCLRTVNEFLLNVAEDGDFY